MRFFHLLNVQHVMGLIFGALLFLVLFGVALKFSHLGGDDAQARQKKIVHRYPEGIEEREAPFPLVMTLIVAGTLIWLFFYILGTGVLEVVI